MKSMYSSHGQMYSVWGFFFKKKLIVCLIGESLITWGKVKKLGMK